MADFTADEIEDIANYLDVMFDEWTMEGLAVFEGGGIDRAADTFWSKQPDEVKEEHRRRNPESAQLLDSLRKGEDNGIR
jgi:hypothetical protein